MSLVDLSRFFEQLDSEEALQGKEARQFWNPILNTGSELEDWRLRQSGVSRYSSINQQLMLYLVKYDGRLRYRIWRLKPDM